MSIDLQQSLDQLARSVHDDGASERITGQVHHLVSRIRRRRAARQVATGAVGMGAVAAVAVAGVQLAERDGTGAPPAAKQDASGFPACGSIPTDPNPATDWVVSLMVELEPGGVGAGADGLDPAGASVSMSFVGEIEEIVEVVDGPQVALTRDGVVVSPPATVESAMESMPPVFSLRQQAVSCDAASAGEPLPPGDYELVALQTVEFGTGGPVQLFAREPLTIAGVPTVPATEEPAPGVEAELEAAREMLEAHLATPSSAPFPACRSAVVSRSGDVLALELALEDRPYARAERVDGEVTVRTVEERSVIGQAPTSGARLVLTRGGMVVGSTYSDPEEVDLLDLGPQETATVPLNGGMSLCAEPLTDVTQPGLPPGVYEAYAVMEVMLQEVTDASGEATAVTELVLAVSRPVMVTVE